jgi:hypothetical protein
LWKGSENRNASLGDVAAIKNEAANTKPMFGQFTLMGLLGYVTLIAVSLAAFRTGFVAKWPGDMSWALAIR